jgi:hypothetical protein
MYWDRKAQYCGPVREVEQLLRMAYSSHKVIMYVPTIGRQIDDKNRVSQMP